MFLNTRALSPAPSWHDRSLFWNHRTLCGLALPIRTPPDDHWSREVDGAAVLMGTAKATAPAEVLPGTVLPLPAGSALRLLLVDVFSIALQTGSTAVEIGPDPAAVAERLGIQMTAGQLADLAEQAHRLIGAKLRIVDRGRTPVPVFDARRQNARGGVAWRPTLHLGERFFASLQSNAVPLERDAVVALAGSAAVFDAYGWLAATRPTADAEEAGAASWAELQQRFGHGGGSAAAFRTAFKRSLDKARTSDPARPSEVGTQDRPPADAIDPVSAVLEGPPESPPVALASAAAAGAVAAVTAPVPREVENERILVAPDPTPANDARPRQPDQARIASTGPAGPAAGDGSDPIRLAPSLTGLRLSVWLRHGEGQHATTIEVTPGGDYHSARRSLLTLEPMILQVVGHLQKSELDQVAAWAVSNAEVIQDYWDGLIASASDVVGRVKPVAVSRW